MPSTTAVTKKTSATFTAISTTPESLFDLVFTDACKVVLDPNYDPNDKKTYKKIVAELSKKMLNLLASDNVPVRASSALTLRQQRYIAPARAHCQARGLKEARKALRLASWCRALQIDISEDEWVDVAEDE